MAEPHQRPDTAERLTRLEEAVGFADRNAEQLSEQVIALNREVASLARRLAMLERRMADLQDGVTDAPLVPPPHSAGPDVPKEPL
jgi:uncharacterized coiled-coil protein SlyX